MLNELLFRCIARTKTMIMTHPNCRKDHSFESRILICRRKIGSPVSVQRWCHLPFLNCCILFEPCTLFHPFYAIILIIVIINKYKYSLRIRLSSVWHIIYSIIISSRNCRSVCALYYRILYVFILYLLFFLRTDILLMVGKSKYSYLAGFPIRASTNYIRQKNR